MPSSDSDYELSWKKRRYKIQSSYKTINQDAFCFSLLIQIYRLIVQYKSGITHILNTWLHFHFIVVGQFKFCFDYRNRTIEYFEERIREQTHHYICSYSYTIVSK